MISKSGKVYLIGAGPGDPGLITLKGKKALEACDAVVYDHLASLELVVTLPPRIERHYVGKSAGKHTQEQDEINRLLADLAKKGFSVARLKAGDPFVFGRGGEEALYLKENGIPFEVIPGITAGVACPSAAGIPLTHRGLSAFAIFLTAHQVEEKDPSYLPWETISQLHNGAIVGYMGVETLPDIVQKLIDNGMKSATPVALIENGTRSTQRTFTGTLDNIAEIARINLLRPLALFVIGHVVQLADKLKDTSEKPLAGCTIMVTRPAGQINTMCEKIRRLGGEPLPLPAIVIEEFYDKSEWEKFAPLTEGWLIFTSENGVRGFFRRFLQLGGDLRSIARFRIACIGSGTCESLLHYGLKADFLPAKFTAKSLTEELLGKFQWDSIPAVRVKGNLSDDSIEKGFAEAGVRLFPLTVYCTSTARWDAGMWEAFKEVRIDTVAFTSASTVQGLKEIIGDDQFQRLLNSTFIASIGPSTSQALKKLGCTNPLEASTHTVDGLIETLCNHFQNK